MLVGVAVFFADARRSRALRVAGAVIMGIPASSLVLIQLNTIWLGFVPESSYTGRMAFLLLLTMVALAFEGIAFCLDNKNETLVVAGNPKNRPKCEAGTALRAVVGRGAAAFHLRVPPSTCGTERSRFARAPRTPCSNWY